MFLISIHRIIIGNLSILTDICLPFFFRQENPDRMRTWLSVVQPVSRPAAQTAAQHGRNLPKRPSAPAAATGQRPLWPPTRLGRPAGGDGNGPNDRRASDRDQHAGQPSKMALPAWRRYRWLTLPRPPEVKISNTSGLNPTIFLLYFALLFSSGKKLSKYIRIHSEIEHL